MIEFLHNMSLSKSMLFVGSVYCSILLINRRKWMTESTVFIVGVLWFFYHDSVLEFIGGLGVDSFAEAKSDFNLKEAGFWLSTLSNAIKPRLYIFRLFITLVCAVFSFYCLRWIFYRHDLGRKYFSVIILSIVIIFTVLSLQKAISDSISTFLNNSENVLITRRDFNNKPPLVKKKGRPVDLIIYIGESTTVMNMGLYGYPRNTTPHLSRLAKKDPNFIQFYNVFSTHTHTSPSLLEALSLPINKNDDFLPINLRKRVPLVDVLKSIGIRSCLRSNQGMAGTWNEASSIIFKNADKTFSVDNRLYGNNDDLMKKPWDDKFFEKQLAANQGKKINGASLVTFLHSYAGHGPYYDNIPNSFRKPVDDYLSVYASKKLTDESNSDLKEGIDNYDSAIKYVDYSVSKTVDYVRRSKNATIMIYFSDHGESVFTGRGHESGRFIHEMARVPFLLYFNDAAIKESPDLYLKYVRLSKGREPATLAQLSSVVLDLMNIRMDPVNQTSAYVKPLIGEKCTLSPIVIREVSDGITYVNLNKENPLIPKGYRYRIKDVTDAATLDFVESRNNLIKSNEISKRHVTSFEQERRMAMIR